MPGRLLLIEGPAGGGKSQHLRNMLDDGALDVAIEFTPIWASLRGYRRGADGHYPVRLDDDRTAAIAGGMMHAGTRLALRAGLRTGVTTGSSGRAESFAEIAADELAEFDVRTIDPGREVVERRLAAAFPDPETGGLRTECAAALDKWYG